MNEFYINKLNHLNNLSIYFKEYNAVNGRLRAILLFVPFAIIPTILPPVFCTLSMQDYNEFIQFLEENIKYGHFLTLLESLFLLPLGTFISLTDYFYNYRRSLKIENGINHEIEGLRQFLTKKKENLENLKLLRSIEDNNYKSIEELGNFYYEIGYNYDKYLKYYQKGVLRKKLQKKHSEEKILGLEQYFEEKGFVRERIKIEKSKMHFIE